MGKTVADSNVVLKTRGHRNDMENDVTLAMQMKPADALLINTQ